ncbi:MAG TPA: tetratricopeptide repeat protein [Kofleriaceae bacterium]
MKRAIAIVALWSAGAAAQPAGAQAEVLFRQGRDLLKAGKVDEACAAFDESEKLDPAITTLINLAGCREKQGELATAWGLFLDAERQTRSASDANTRQLHDLAADRAHKLEPLVSKLAINVPQQSMVDGLEVSRNGERIDPTMWNRAMPIDGGTYTIDAKAPGSSTWSTKIAVGGQADTKTVDVPDLRSLPRDLSQQLPQQPQAVVVLPPPATEPERSYTLPIAVGAGSLVVLGGALGLELWGEAKYNDAKNAVDPERNTLYDAANARRYAAEGVAVVGVLGAGAAVWLFVRDRGERHPARGVSIELVPTGAGFLVRGSY